MVVISSYSNYEHACQLIAMYFQHTHHDDMYRKRNVTGVLREREREREICIYTYMYETYENEIFPKPSHTSPDLPKPFPYLTQGIPKVLPTWTHFPDLSRTTLHWLHHQALEAFMLK